MIAEPVQRGGAFGRRAALRRAGGVAGAAIFPAAGTAAALGEVACQSGTPGGKPLKVGLVAPFTGRSAASGEAIQRGMVLAAEEVNVRGGVLGRPLQVVVRDVQNDPAAGEAALRDLAARDGIMAVFGGIYSPVMLRQLDVLAEMRLPLVNAWGSVTGITQNNRAPNWAFRTGISDDIADEFLARYAAEVVGARRPAVMVDTTAWGDSNLEGLGAQLRGKEVTIAGVERFDQGDTSMVHQLERLRGAGADAVVMAADTAEGAAIVRGMAALGWRVPVVSHWGVAGGQFPQLAGLDTAEGVLTLQTFTFYEPRTPRADAVLRAYHAKFGTRRVDEIPAAIGVAHGYDGMNLLALALARAGTDEGPALRDALEHLPAYDGLMKRYDPAFTPTNHDPLTADDCLMAVWRGGRLVPAQPPRLPRAAR